MRETSIIAQKVAEHARIHSLPKHFGARLMLIVERAVYDTLRKLASAYRGGYWHYYELSNGGFYMDLWYAKALCSSAYRRRVSPDGRRAA